MAGRKRRLSRMTGDERRTDSGEVIPLGTTPPPPPQVPTTRPRGLHGIAMALTVTFALIALISFVGFITVGWPGSAGHVVIAILMFSVIGFIASASASVLTAARATYVGYRSTTSSDPESPGPPDEATEDVAAE
ncbi:MAG: hypothetical protein QOH90_1573 [Actinomycetota bacterium]|nr:hypothetical protein [Actinomycetota bacterium]